MRLRGVISSNGNKIVIPEKYQKNWLFFPLETTKTYTNVPFSLSDIRLWLKLSNDVRRSLDLSALAEKGIDYDLIALSDVLDIVEYFQPRDDKWLEYVYIDRNRSTWYERQGREIRLSNKLRYYHNKEEIPFVYNNFYVYYDPVYSFNDKPLPFSLFDKMISNRELCVIAGIVHSTFLMFLSNQQKWIGYPTREELPISLVDWKSVIKLKRPHILSVASLYTKEKMAEIIIEIGRDKRQQVGEVTSVDQALSNVPITVSPVEQLVYPYHRIGAPYINKKEINQKYPLVVNNLKDISFREPNYFSKIQHYLYSILNESMLSYDNEKSFIAAGLSPLFEGGRARDVEEIGLGLQPGIMEGTLECLIPLTNLDIFYKGDLIVNGKIRDNGIDEKDFRDIVEYGIGKIGSDNMIDIAVACVELYERMKIPDQRLLTFAEIVYKIV